jgi:signal transduction histidine kinase
VAAWPALQLSGSTLYPLARIARLPNPKEQVILSIESARTALEAALSDLERLPAFDPGTAVFAAHALSNYLNVTGATVQLLIMSLEEHPDPQVRRWLEGLQHATNLMAHTVTQLLHASAPSDAPLRRDPVELSMMLWRAVAYYQHIADRKQIQLRIEGAEEVPPVMADRVAVAAVLDNLLSNAIKYSPPDKVIWLWLTTEPGHLVCAVQDQGPGITPEDQQRLFQRGAKLGSRPTGNEPSTGYGLAVAKDLVDRMGGEIWCESRFGEGATFAFRLPLAAGSQ